MPAAASTEINTLFKFDSTARSPFCGRSHCALVGLRHLFFPTSLGLGGAGSLRIYSYCHTPNDSRRTCGSPSWILLSPGWVKQAACVSTAAPTHRTAAEGYSDVAIQCLIQDMLSQASKWSYERTWIRLRQVETPGPPKNTALANSATTSTAACIQDKGQASVAKENRWSCSRRLGI